MGRGETRRRDGGRRCVDVHQLEAHRHNKERGKDQASYEDRRRRPSCPVRFRRHVALLLIANLEALWVRRSSRLWMAVIAGGFNRSTQHLLSCQMRRDAYGG